jgi:hypothetical protein
MTMRAPLPSVAVFTISALLAGCQTSERVPRPELASVVISQQMHPDIRSAFDRDYIALIVKGTSAEAIARGCGGVMRIQPQYRQSLDLVLRSNDIEFGRGTSAREVAGKVRDHRRSSDCVALASRLNAGGYPNIFLERVR